MRRRKKRSLKIAMPLAFIAALALQTALAHDKPWVEEHAGTTNAYQERRCTYPLRVSQSGLEAAPVMQGTASEKPFTFTDVDLKFLEKSDQLDRELQEKGLVFADAGTTEYVTTVGHAIIPEGKAPEHVVWRFRVLRDPLPNAFALPNGSIYVNTGLLALLQNEAQLASVLAHETIHVLNRHSYLANRGYRKKMVTIHIIAAAGAAGGMAGGVGGLIADAVGTFVPSILAATIDGYDRKLEREADMEAVWLLSEGGYRVEEMPSTFRLLGETHEVELTKIFYTDHPKLQKRIAYVSQLVKTNPSSNANPVVGAERYFLAVERSARHNVHLDILAGRARTALAVAQHLVDLDPDNSENHYCLGEAWRGLGPRPPEPTNEERSKKGKKKTRNMLKKMTFREYEASLMETAEGKAAWKASTAEAEQAYQEAQALDPANAHAHRGLGFLYEKQERPTEAVREFRRYLQLEPEAYDRIRIEERLRALEKSVDRASVGSPR